MQQIDDYVRAIGEVLENDIFSLELIIPEDNAPLEERLTNICRWAQGFLLGYGLQIQSQVIKSDDLNEALNDLMEISQVELEVEESEEMEQALHTVVEHVRVTSQVVFLETRQFIEQAHKESQQTNTRIH